MKIPYWLSDLEALYLNDTMTGNHHQEFVPAPSANRKAELSLVDPNQIYKNINETWSND